MDYGGDTDAWDALEHFFLSIFLIEVALRITAFGWSFFTDPWNCIDFVVVVIFNDSQTFNILEPRAVPDAVPTAALIGLQQAIGIVDWGFLIVDGAGGNSAFTAVRLVRIFRIIRLFGFFDR